MSKEQLLVARAAEVQLQHAAELMRSAIANLTALQHGTGQAAEAAIKAVLECERAALMVKGVLKRIPLT